MSSDQPKVRIPVVSDPSRIWQLLQAIEQTMAEFSTQLYAIELALEELFDFSAYITASDPNESSKSFDSSPEIF